MSARSLAGGNPDRDRKQNIVEVRRRMNVWRVDTREQSLTRESVPSAWNRLGGRGLVARVLLDAVPATCVERPSVKS